MLRETRALNLIAAKLKNAKAAGERDHSVNDGQADPATAQQSISNNNDDGLIHCTNTPTETNNDESNSAER